MKDGFGWDNKDNDDDAATTATREIWEELKCNYLDDHDRDNSCCSKINILGMIYFTQK